MALTQAQAADLLLPSHKLLVRRREAPSATAPSCVQCIRAACGLGARVLGRHGMIPAPLFTATFVSSSHACGRATLAGRPARPGSIFSNRFSQSRAASHGLDSQTSRRAQLATPRAVAGPDKKVQTVKSQPCIPWIYYTDVEGFTLYILLTMYTKSVTVNLQRDTSEISARFPMKRTSVSQ